MSKLDEIKKPIITEMQIFEKHFKDTLKSDIPLLDIITHYIYRRKGKQMRPLFVFLSAALCGTITETTYTAATLIELLHTATLIHDDVVDDSYERRGVFSINAMWRTKIAVLLGDYLLSRGLLLSLDHKEYQLLHTVSNAVKEMSEGELLQIKSARKLIIDKENYFNIIHKKTASLISACTLCGAQSAKANSEVQHQMKEFGINVGIAFQIKDDLFDFQESKAGIGKPTGNDLKDKKFTLPLILALENCKQNEIKQVKKVLNSNNTDKHTQNFIKEFVVNNKGIELATIEMQNYVSKALNNLSQLPNNEYKEKLIELVNYTTERKS